MTSEDKFKILTTKPRDEQFHRSRIMFCIKDGKIEVEPQGTKNSHLEWFREEGWVTEENTESFLNKTIRGFYQAAENTFYCYKGVGFWYDDEMVKEVIERLSELKQALNFQDDTKICFGPKDSPVDGIEYPRHCGGTLKEIIK